MNELINDRCSSAEEVIKRGEEVQKSRKMAAAKAKDVVKDITDD